MIDLRAAFADPPRSTQSAPRQAQTWTYIRQPTSSLDWRGAAWASPISLSFETETMHASRFSAQIGYTTETESHPIHPIDLIRDLAELWEKTRAYLAREEYVIDASEHLGITFHAGLRTIVLRLQAKCWPSIEGITVPKRDVTL